MILLLEKIQSFRILTGKPDSLRQKIRLNCFFFNSTNLESNISVLWCWIRLEKIKFLSTNFIPNCHFSMIKITPSLKAVGYFLVVVVPSTIILLFLSNQTMNSSVLGLLRSKAGENISYKWKTAFVFHAIRRIVCKGCKDGRLINFQRSTAVLGLYVHELTWQIISFNTYWSSILFFSCCYTIGLCAV